MIVYCGACVCSIEAQYLLPLPHGSSKNIYSFKAIELYFKWPIKSISSPQ